VTTDGSPINPRVLERLNITNWGMMSAGIYILEMTREAAEQVKTVGSVASVEQLSRPAGRYEPYIFPHKPEIAWNEDNFGPVYIPKKGATIAISPANIDIYRRIIDVYEGNDLEVNGDQILINGTPATSYTFKLDYYWMMGDNRHNSADSRFWGFVPEDHIVGSAMFVWLSLDKEKSFPGNIRFNKTFRVIR
jgi:signal peptidase I